MTDVPSVPGTPEVFTEEYLYGGDSVPKLLTDRLRDTNANVHTQVTTPAADYMATYGRYAVPAYSPIVKQFFAGSFLSGKPAGSYKLSDLPGADPAFSILNATIFDPTSSPTDFFNRAYIAGHAPFILGPDTTFVIGSDGSRHIENLVVIPTHDNFDFQSTEGSASQTFNDTVLIPQIDPYFIGRTVDWDFTDVDQLSPVYYDAAAYARDVGRIESWTISETAAGAMLADLAQQFISKAKQSGLIEYFRDGRKIIYDGYSTNPGSANPVPPANTLSSDVAAILVAGGGNDEIKGSPYDDIIYGGSGADTIRASAGSDEIHGDNESAIAGSTDTDVVDYRTFAFANLTIGENSSKVDKPFGTDTLYDVEQIILSDADDKIKLGDVDGKTPLPKAIDAGGGKDTLDVSGYKGGVTVNLSNSSNQSLQFGSTTIHLSGVEDVIGTDADDTIIRRPSGGTSAQPAGLMRAAISAPASVYRTSGGGGNDLIVGGDGTDIIDGGSGSDTIELGNGDTFTDPDGGDRVSLNDLWLTGGEKEKPPTNPCDPQTPPNDDGNENGTYIGRNGDLYELSGSNLVVSANGASATIENFRNGDAGIRLRPKRPDEKQAECKRDPLIIDLNGDKQVVNELFDSTAYFDLDNDGFAERVAWTLSGDGFLAIDRNGNGKIDDGTELFGTGSRESDAGTETSSGTAGFTDLSILDSNFDHQITAADTMFESLRVWIDANGNGVTDEGELKSLSELGIVSISLKTETADNQDCGCDGTLVTNRANVTFADNSTTGIYDAFLAIDQYDTRELDTPDVPDDVRGLPFLIGSGTLSDLDVAMTRDPTLKQMVEEFAGLDAAHASEINARVEQIILRWTGADSVAPDSRGFNMNARWLAAIEKISGSAFNQAKVGTNPRADAAGMLILEWEKITQRVTAQLLGQTSLGQTLLPGLNFAAAAFYEAGDGASLDQAIASAVANAPAGRADQLSYWHSIIGTVLQFKGALNVTDDQVYAAFDGALASSALGVSAKDIAKLLEDTQASGALTGVTYFAPDIEQIDENDVFLAKSSGSRLNGGAGNDIYLVSKDARNVSIKDSSGIDRLVLFDQARNDVQVSVQPVSQSQFNGSRFAFDLTFSNAAANWSLDLQVVIADGQVQSDVDTVAFADGQSLNVTSLISSMTPLTDGSGALYVGSGSSPFLAGGAGNDIVIGTGLSDAYTMGPGTDVIVDKSDLNSTDDQLFINANPSDVTFEAAGEFHGDLVVRTAEGATTTISNQFSNPLQAIDTFRFADGSVLTAAELRASLNTGSTSADTLTGTAATDLIDGGGGNDLVDGGFGNDSYIFRPGYGSLTIHDAYGVNDVNFEDGILSTDVSVSVSGNTVTIGIDGTDDQVVLQNVDLLSRYSVHFADADMQLSDLLSGQGITGAWSRDGVIYGTPGDDEDIEGTDQGDTIDGLGGRDLVDGGNGDDIYRYSGGELEIFDTGNGFDVIEPSADYSINQLILTSDGIRFEGHDGGILIDKGVEGIVFADGQKVTLGASNLLGTAGNDVLYDFSGQAVTFRPGTGDDRIFATDAPNTKTIFLDRNFGHDVFYPGGSQFNLDLTAFTLDSSIGFSRQGNDLIISTDGGTNAITIKNGFDPFNGGRTGSYSLSQFKFANGVTLSMADVDQRISIRTPGDDILFGTAALDGGAGNDVLIGDILANNYTFGRGYGNDVIKEQAFGFREPSAQDTLTLAGLNPSDISFARSIDDPKSIVITIKDTGETLTLDGTPFDDYHFLSLNQYPDPQPVDKTGAHWIERIVFADGTVWAQKDIEQQLLDRDRTVGNDTIVSFGAPDVSSGLAGAYLDGGAGDDTYINDYGAAYVRFGAGYGTDVLHEAWGDHNVTVQLVGTSASDVDIGLEVRDGETYTVLHAKDGSSLAIAGGLGFLLKLNVVDPSGTVYTPLQDGGLIAANAGTAGIDYLRGATTGGTANTRPDPVNDVFTPGAGNDVIAGYGGDDVVRFSRGDGADVLLDSVLMGSSSNKSQTYTIAFAAGISRSDVSFSWVPDGSGNIRIAIAGGSDSITLPPQTLSALKFDDGTVVRTKDIGDGAELLNLASFRPAPTAGDDILYVGPNETINGGTGNDTIYYAPSGDGNLTPATIEWGPGSGNDTFANVTSLYHASNSRTLPVANTRHTIKLSGINSISELNFIRDPQSPNDLVIEIKATDERLTIKDEFYTDPGMRFDAIATNLVLANGSSYWLPDIWNGQAGPGGSGGDEVVRTGPAGGVLDGGAGNDQLQGGTGNDVYVFGRGYNEDTITDAGGSNTLVFDDGITPDDVYYSRTGDNGQDLLIEVTGAERLSMTVKGQFASSNPVIGTFQFASGDRRDAQDIQDFILGTAETSGDDLIQGFAGNDRIDSGSGNDRITGGSGDDIIDGGANRDAAVFSGARSEYEITTANGVITVRDTVAGRDGTDQLTNVEDLIFLKDGSTDALVQPNAAPTAATFSLGGTEDNELVIARSDLLAHTGDADGDPLMLSISGSANGQAWIDLSGNIHFKPAKDFSGSASFDYKVADGNGGSAIARVAIDVTAVNDAPQVVQTLGEVSFAEDQPVSFTLPAGLFKDVDSASLSIGVSQAGQQPLPSWLTFVDGRLSGQPPQNFNGTLQLLVSASDGQSTTTTPLALTIAPVNDAPIASGTIANQRIAPGQSLSVAIGSALFNDSDGDPLSLSVVQASGDPLPSWLSYQNGLLSGIVPSDFAGPLNLAARATDGGLFAVIPFAFSTNQAPELVAPLPDVTVLEDTPVDFALPPLNFFDSDGDQLNYSARLADLSSLPPWLAFDPTTRRFNGTPPANFNGNIDIEIAANDGESSATDVFRLVIAPVNDAPTVSGHLSDLAANEGRAFAAGVDTSIFHDVDGDALSFSATMAGGSPLPAWLTFTNGQLTGTPPAHSAGNYALSIIASDGSASVATGLNFTVSGGNSPPVAVDDSLFVTVRGQQLYIAQADLLANDHDPDGDPLSIASVSNAAHGTVSLNPDGTIVYTPDGGYMGADSFQYVLCDGHSTGTANVGVRVDDPFASWSQGTDAGEKIFGNLNATNHIAGLGGDDHIKGGHEADWLAGGLGDDNLNGLNGDDNLWGMEGNDTLEGSSGTDTAYYFGVRSSYVLSTVNGTLTIRDTQPTVDGDDGTDTLTNIERLSFKSGDVMSITSPIILDLVGTGVQTVSAANSAASFDMDGDGYLDDTSWIGSGSAFLFLDRDGNGTLSNVGEMSFTGDAPGATTDLEGLKAFDSNGDGMISGADDRFKDFKLWRDANGNGIVDGGEILSLDQVGLSSISLTAVAQNSTVQIGDVAVVNTSSWTRNDGAILGVADAMMTFFSGAPQVGDPAIRPPGSELDLLPPATLEGESSQPKHVPTPVMRPLPVDTERSMTPHRAALSGELREALEELRQERLVGHSAIARTASGFRGALSDRAGTEATFSVEADGDLANGRTNLAGSAQPAATPALEQRLLVMSQDLAAFGTLPAVEIEERKWRSEEPLNLFAA